MLVGANSAGKTTVAEALYLAHPQSFPSLPRPSAAALGAVRPRTIEISYSLEDEFEIESDLGEMLRDMAQPAPVWTRELLRNLGQVRVSGPNSAPPPGYDKLRLIYLPAYRNPLDELARREARILIELMRAQQFASSGARSLRPLRQEADRLLSELRGDGLLEAVEDRIKKHLSALSDGVSPQFAFMGGRQVDDRFLGRVFELLLGTVDDRTLGQHLEISGLGYVNLLHIAVTLAAIPDPNGDAGVDGLSGDVSDHPPTGSNDLMSEVDPEDVADEAEADEDTFFPEAFHVTVVIEEPEAHLHPQLQHGLARYLRQVVELRPEIQIVLSTHSGEIMAACEPQEIVAMKRLSTGRRVSRVVARLPLKDRNRTLRMAALHLDATRSSALFAPRLALVEGVTEAVLLRQLARAWAAGDDRRERWADSLTIIAMGTEVGRWPVDLLACPEHEIADRIGILSDTDHREAGPYQPPAWHLELDDRVAKVFYSEPTLEPTLVTGNEDAVEAALQLLPYRDTPDEPTSETVDLVFRNKTGRKYKAQFALLLADEFRRRVRAGEGVQVPEAVLGLLEFLWGNSPTPAE